MQHPHHVADCTLSQENNDLSCNNLPRFRNPRLSDDNQTLEVTCQTQAHTVAVDELSDRTLETIVRRLCERNKEHRKDERERLLGVLRERGVEIPDNPTETTWFVIELEEKRVRELEEGAYPEAYQMAQLAHGENYDDSLGRTDDDTLKAMLVSQWGLKHIPDDLTQCAVALDESAYDRESF